MEKIEFEMTTESLLAHAGNAMKKNKWYLAIQNLNDALDKCTTREGKKKVFLAYADVFLAAGNMPLFRYSLYMASKTDYAGGFFYLDYNRFLPDPPYDAPAGEPEPSLTASAILSYNEVYNLIAQKRYSDAMRLFFTLPSDRKSMASVVDALSVAIDSDKDFHLDTYIISLLPAIGEFAAEDPAFIKMLLTASESTKAIAVEGAKYFIEDNEDIDLLRDLGTEYFLASEITAARLFFEKVLSLCEIDEVALYYMYVISVMEKQKEDAAKYRAKFFTVNRFAMPPMVIIDLTASTSNEDNVTEYMTLSESNEEAFYNDILRHMDEELDDKQFVRIKHFACAGNPFLVNKILQSYSKKKEPELFLKLCNVILESPYVGKEVKNNLIHTLLECGCDGTVYYNSPEKALIFTASKFRHRFGEWNKIYLDASETIIKSDGYIPYHSELLQSVVKKCRTRMEQFMGEHYNLYLFVVIISYVHRLDENVTLSDLSLNFDLPPGELESFLGYFSMESPIV